MESIGKKIGVRDGDLSPWYNLNTVDFLRLGGRGILSHYNNSIYQMLINIYPDYNWVPWNFNSITVSILRNPETIKLVMEHISKKIKIQSNDEWYRVSNSDLKQLKVYNVIKSNGGIYKCLKEFLPTVEWNESSFLSI